MPEYTPVLEMETGMMHVQYLKTDPLPPRRLYEFPPPPPAPELAVERASPARASRQPAPPARTLPVFEVNGARPPACGAAASDGDRIRMTCL